MIQVNVNSECDPHIVQLDLSVSIITIAVSNVTLYLVQMTSAVSICMIAVSNVTLQMTSSATNIHLYLLLRLLYLIILMYIQMTSSVFNVVCQG